MFGMSGSRRRKRLRGDHTHRPLPLVWQLFDVYLPRRHHRLVAFYESEGFRPVPGATVQFEPHEDSYFRKVPMQIDLQVSHNTSTLLAFHAIIFCWFSVFQSAKPRIWPDDRFLTLRVIGGGSALCSSDSGDLSSVVPSHSLPNSEWVLNWHEDESNTAFVTLQNQFGCFLCVEPSGATSRSNPFLTDP